MTAKRRDPDEEVTLRVKRGDLTVVAPAPATVTQRNCLEVFGLTKADFLRMAGRDFPVTARGKLRIARYADVEAALTASAKYREKGQAKPGVKRGKLDYDAILRDAGFRAIARNHGGR